MYLANDCAERTRFRRRVYTRVYIHHLDASLAFFSPECSSPRSFVVRERVAGEFTRAPARPSKRVITSREERRVISARFKLHLNYISRRIKRERSMKLSFLFSLSPSLPLFSSALFLERFNLIPFSLFFCYNKRRIFYHFFLFACFARFSRAG